MFTQHARNGQAVFAFTIAMALATGCGGAPEGPSDGSPVPALVPPPKYCSKDAHCGSMCSAGTCVDHACEDIVHFENGTLCGEGGECIDGQCTLIPHGPECGEVTVSEFPTAGDGKTVILCDRCSHSCEPLSAVACDTYGACCEYSGLTCISHCTGCCDGSVGALRCEVAGP